MINANDTDRHIQCSTGLLCDYQWTCSIEVHTETIEKLLCSAYKTDIIHHTCIDRHVN